MSKTALAAALIVGAASAAHAATTATYTFANTTGTPYCDGIALTEYGVVATGSHIGVTCTEGDYAGGFESKLAFTGTLDWVIASNESLLSNSYVIVYTLDPKALTWTSWIESTADGITFEEAGSGDLLTGAVPARNGKPSKTPAVFGHAAGR